MPGVSVDDRADGLETDPVGHQASPAAPGPRPRVGIDAGALRFPAGGVRRYGAEVFSRLAALAPELEFVSVDRASGEAIPPGMADGPRAAALPTNVGRAVALGRAIGRAGLDLFHAPAYTAPFSSVPTVLTIHDVSYARRPDFYAHRAGPLRQWFYRRSARRAAQIITDSQFSKDEILAAYGISPGRVSVVPLGVGPPFTPGEPSGADELPNGARPPFVLHVGDLHRRRDLATAVQAVLVVNRLRRTGLPPLQLVCAGHDAGSAEELRRLTREAGAPDDLVLPGAVDEHTLLALYRSAHALVYPSLYEGFGLPVLEAMACGLPVVAARAGSVPEVVAEAGILVAPGDVRAFAEAISALADRPDLWQTFAAQGVARASSFTWDRTARETVDVYRACLNTSALKRGCSGSRAGVERENSGNRPVVERGSLEVSIIVLNYNGRKWLEACLESLGAQAHVDAELILVDNASTDDSVTFVRERFPSVRLVQLEKNLGFAGGNNAGARVARAPYLAFLNNDTDADPGWAACLRDALEVNPNASLATSRIVYRHDPAILDSAGDGYLRAGGAFKRGHGQPAVDYLEATEVFGACGAAFMIRRAVFQELGGFDEDLFLVYEDVDLSYRAQLRGYLCLYVPGACVRHAGSATMGTVSRTSVFYGQRNLEWVYFKNSPGRILLRTLPWHVIYSLAGGLSLIPAGLFGVWCSAKWEALKGMPAVVRKRRAVQRSRRTDPHRVWALMSSSWLMLKWREKRFDRGTLADR